MDPFYNESPTNYRGRGYANPYYQPLNRRGGRSRPPRAPGRAIGQTMGAGRGAIMAAMTQLTTDRTRHRLIEAGMDQRTINFLNENDPANILVINGLLDIIERNKNSPRSESCIEAHTNSRGTTPPIDNSTTRTATPISRTTSSPLPSRSTSNSAMLPPQPAFAKPRTNQFHPYTQQPIVKYDRLTMIEPIGERAKESPIRLDTTFPRPYDKNDNNNPEYCRETGRVPDLWGIKEVNGVMERDNNMRGMLSYALYYTEHNNTVYAGWTGLMASKNDFHSENPFRHDPHHAVYHAAKRGLPMTPNEVRNLITLVRDPQGVPSYRFEAHLILSEFQAITTRVPASQLDRAMRWLADASNFDTNRDRPHTPVEDIPTEGPMRDLASIQDEVGEIYMPRPEAIDTMSIDKYAELILYRHFPGLVNYIHGIAMDHMRRVNSSGDTRPQFVRCFAMLAALPGRYQEYINEHNEANPNNPFREQTGPIFTLYRVFIDRDHDDFIDIKVVATTLIDNKIPPSWVDHSYPFGLRVLDQLVKTSQMPHATLVSIDNDRQRRLRTIGVPPAIVAWDGWRPPSPEDHLRLSVAFERVYMTSGNYPTSSVEWVKVGDDVNYPHLRHRALLDTLGYEGDDKRFTEVINPPDHRTQTDRRDLAHDETTHTGENTRTFDPSRPRGRSASPIVRTHSNRRQ
ncbi:hypothetical protein Agabi119p4_9196 [Agaricus bisporus var. burnettii]|uniref:Uncharacterized protein n=1 Tax=Agaricus bisporus var. burnettii TaxID=192524 RepID=A0A8H7C5V7_AGABI|nr:hypothetical protein Agabi119p4_9196 [Agaricus bisporus var. burnettii]